MAGFEEGGGWGDDLIHISLFSTSIPYLPLLTLML